MNEEKTYWGKYRGTVDDNVDPESRGRLTLKIPDVLGDTSSTWAEPCAPLAGPAGSAMGVYMVPPINAGVWVEFEQGNPDHPIWVGCRFDKPSDVPKQACAGSSDSPNIIIQTKGGNSFMISDTDGLTLKNKDGASITINDTGISLQIQNGASIIMTGKTVKINDGALEIK